MTPHDDAGSEPAGGAPDDEGDGPTDDEADGTPDDEGWRFSVDDVSEDGVDEGSLLGPASDERTVVGPGDPDVENAVFVVLGVLVSLALVAAVLGAV